MDIYAELQVLLEWLRQREALARSDAPIAGRVWNEGRHYHLGRADMAGHAADQLEALIHHASRTDPRECPEDAAELKW